MIRVIVKNINDKITNSSDFETQEEADAWIELNTNANIWGKPARWLAPSEFINETIEESVESAQIEILGQDVTIYKFPSDFTVEQVDVTDEYNLTKKKNISLAAINLGADLMADIRTLNEIKLENQTMSEQDFVSLLANQDAFNIERALWNGSLVTAKTLIQAFSGYYTTDEKNELIEKIDAFLSENP